MRKRKLMVERDDQTIAGEQTDVLDRCRDCDHRLISQRGSTVARPEVNVLLERLPEDERQALMRRMHRIDLPVNTVLYRANQRPQFAHFMVSGAATVSTDLPSGGTALVGIVGKKDLVETSHLLGPHSIPRTAVVRVPGFAWRMPFEELRQEFLTSMVLRDRILENVQQAQLLSEQAAACNAWHESLGRLATWLLLLTKPVAPGELALTQDELAKLLSIRRTTITMSVKPLKHGDILQFRRGRLTILDRSALTALACECFNVISRLRSGEC